MWKQNKSSVFIFKLFKMEPGASEYGGLVMEGEEFVGR